MLPVVFNLHLLIQFLKFVPVSFICHYFVDIDLTSGEFRFSFMRINKTSDLVVTTDSEEQLTDGKLV